MYHQIDLHTLPYNDLREVPIISVRSERIVSSQYDRSHTEWDISDQSPLLQLKNPRGCSVSGGTPAATPSAN